MHKNHYTTYRIEERSYVSIVKRDINRLLKENGFSAQKVGELDIIVSEMTSNLIKHATNGGYLMYKMGKHGTRCYFDIFCIDDGPGDADIMKMMKDGMSSSNTLGQGLGAIMRLSDVFQIFSEHNWGTVLYMRKNMYDTPMKYEGRPRPLQIKVIQEAIPGESVCGDGHCIKEFPGSTHILVGDGLGHGPHAMDAMVAATEAFTECEEESPVEILRYIHGKVKKTRGLVGAVAILNHAKKQWLLAGIGNIATRIYKGPEYKSFLSYNGIIGMNIPTSMSDTVYEADNYQIIVMTSDGIRNKWDLATHSAILKQSPAIIAGSIFKDDARRTDDMTVLVGKLNF